LIYLTPRGRLFDQSVARSLAKADGVTLLCGRYEGVDQRVIEAWDMDEISVGDFVLSGGEAAAITVLDAVIRLLPGVMGSPDSLSEESFEQGILEYPHYTRPEKWNGRTVPEVLRSGHHKNIETWRQDQAETITRSRRPDLWDRFVAAETNKKG
jgi:tRNA (guanine37-N1)-methyltransferase